MNGWKETAEPKTLFLSIMKKFLLLLSLLAVAFVAGAQKVYFLYLQSDNGAPFYVRLGEKVHSSTASGYVILSNLIDSNYILQVGFAGQNAESKFPVSLNKEDKGYILKQVGGSWNLFDLQQLTLIKALAATGPTEAENQQLLAAADPFTRMLVQASDDMTLLLSGPSAPAMNTVAAAQTAPPETTTMSGTTQQVDGGMAQNAGSEPVAIMPAPIKTALSEAKPVQAVFTPEPSVATAEKARRDTMPTLTEPVFPRSEVTRRSESSTTEGFGLVFIDKQGEGADTIRLLIPNPKEVKASPATIAAVPVTTAPAAEQKPDTPTINMKPELSVADSALAPVVTPPAAAPPSGCIVQADDKDFLKLRRNMAAAEDEAGMMAVARKNFKSRCYNTEQLRHLSTLFLTAVGKYNFFEAAWGHVSDAAQFASLGAELKEEYFSKRFQDLIK
jgi:hypothetical protein